MKPKAARMSDEVMTVGPWKAKRKVEMVIWRLGSVGVNISML